MRLKYCNLARRCGSIYPLIAIVALKWWWFTLANDLVALADALGHYQQNGSDNLAEAKLAIALTRVVEKRIRPSLAQKLQSQDIDDVCSEITLGFWKYRHSVRTDETSKFIHTLTERKTADQVRKYYGDAQRQVDPDAADVAGLIKLLRNRAADPGGEASQEVWEQLYSLDLNAQDHLVAYMVYLGTEKQIIAKVLGIGVNTVTNSLKRCREDLAQRGVPNSEEE